MTKPSSTSSSKWRNPPVLLALVGGVLLGLGFYGYQRRFERIQNSKWDWIFLQLSGHCQNKQLNYLFVGSSYTWMGIDPRVIDESGNSLNFGRTSHGRDSDYLIVKEALIKCPMKEIFIEIREEELRESHYEWSQLRGVGEILDELWHWKQTTAVQARGDLGLADRGIFLGTTDWPRLRDFASGVARSAGAWIKFAPESWMGRFEDYARDLACEQEICQGLERRLGHYADDKSAPAERKVQFLDEAKVLRRSEFVYDFDSRYHHYLKAIQQVAAAKNVEINFVFVPEINRTMPSLSAVRAYRQMGEVYLPDFRVLNQAEHWMDPTHFSRSGAALFSKELKALLDTSADASKIWRSYYPELRSE